MHTKNLLSILVLFSLVTACNLQMGPTTQPADADAIGTAVELTTIAKFTEMAGSVTAMPTPLPTLTVAPVATLTPESVVPVSGSCSPTVTANVNANVRSGPGTAYDAIGSLIQGQTTTIVGRNDAYTWWYIDYPGVSGGHGWIAGSVVTSSCVPAVVQVVAAPPLPTQEVVAADDDSDDENNNDEDTDAGSGSSALPDLVPTGMSVSPNPATQGEEVQIMVGAKNQGDARTGSFTMQWWSSHSKVVCEWTVSSLAPGESVNKSCSYTYNGWATYDIKLVIDSGNAVAESNEGNNSMARKLKVQDAP